MRGRSAFVLASAAGMAIAIGCSSGGSGSVGTDPVSQCQDFVALTNDCAQRAGKQTNANGQACSDPSALDDRTRGQMECALAHREAYCNSIIAAFSRDAAAISPTDPEVIQLNACVAARTTVSPCKDAVLALADCGVAYYFAPECTGSSAALAKCVLDNTAGACALFGPREGGATFPPEAQSFQQCQIEASKVPDPDPAGDDAGL